MLDKKTMTLNLSESEMEALDKLSEKKGLSKTALVRQALRLYQSVTDRIDTGAKILVENPQTKEKTELLVL
jgi:hypothetical protein